MIRAESVALVLLAAGRSRRFGDGDKLAHPLGGTPLALHVVEALAPMPFGARIAVVCDTKVDFAARGFSVVRNAAPEAGQARSLALGVAAARAAGAEAVLVALADMPRVTRHHVLRMLDEARGSGALLASSEGDAPRPPALFGRDHFDALEALEGDRGARDLIRRGRLLLAPPGTLIDVDTPEDLAQLPHV